MIVKIFFVKKFSMFNILTNWNFSKKENVRNYNRKKEEEKEGKRVN
jgi:hypothetical protein